MRPTRWQRLEAWWLAKQPTGHDILFLAGAMALGWGLHLVYPPLPWIVLGAGAVVAAVLAGARRPRGRPPSR